MKSIVILTFAAIIALVSSDLALDLQENSKPCAVENKLSQEDVRKIQVGEMKPADVTPNMSCYALCLSEKIGITKNGVFQPDVLTKKIGDSPTKVAAAQKAIAACKDIKGINNCDTSFKIMSCLYQNKIL